MISLSTLSSVLSSDISPEEIPSSRLLKKISLVPKIPRKYPIEKVAIAFLSVKKLTISKKSERSKEEISQEQRNRKYKQPQNFRSTMSETAEKDVNKHRQS